jgi:hypothetical protein
MRPLLVGLLLLLTSCARHIPEPRVSPSSPLAQVQIGMGLREVISILGAPPGQHNHRNSLGGDSVETELHYRGLGRVILAAGAFAQFAVIRVEEDSSEPGL